MEGRSRSRIRVDWEDLPARFLGAVLLEEVVGIQVEALGVLWVLWREACLEVGRSRIILSNLETILVRSNSSMAVGRLD